MNRLLILLFLISNVKLTAQNIFRQKIEGCQLSQFCLDCGEPKASYEPNDFKRLLEGVNSAYNFRGSRGQIGFQILIDSLGNGCVLSHTDESRSKLTKDLVRFLNNLIWKPAYTDSKPVNASINVFFEITDNKLTGKIQRVDIAKLNENMSNPGEPEIYNKRYHYSNKTLNAYEITVWQKNNSNLPSSMSRICTIDKNDNVWYGTYDGFARFQDGEIFPLNEDNSPFKSKESIRAISVDSNNIKWVYTSNKLYKFNDKEWEEYNVPGIKFKSIYKITSNNNETFLCSDTGVIIIKSNTADVVSSKEIKQFSSNHIFNAYRDKKGRLWVGSFEGSVMIDKENNVTEFNKTETPLKEVSITETVEDEDGNIYFALYAYNAKGHRNRAQEGIAIYTKEGEWKHFNDTNSGLPANHVNSLLYDKFEKVLWIGTNEAGLVRYDLKENWENYHNQNSKIPSSYIFDMAQDSKGNIYISTFNGMTRITKK